MGMTLWIHTLEDREFSKDSDDHSLMHMHADALDAACDAVGVRKLSDFFDYTDLEYNIGDETDEDDENENESATDPETGYGYGIDDMQWFAADEGLITLRKLRDDVESGAVEAIDDDDKDALLEELDDCIAVLEATAAHAGQFHLAVVE